MEILSNSVSMFKALVAILAKIAFVFRGRIGQLLLLSLGTMMGLLFASCHSTHPENCRLLFEKKFTLTAREPYNQQFQIELIGVATDGSVRLALRKQGFAVSLKSNQQQNLALSDTEATVRLQESDFASQMAGVIVTYQGQCN